MVTCATLLLLVSNGTPPNFSVCFECCSFDNFSVFIPDSGARFDSFGKRFNFFVDVRAAGLSFAGVVALEVFFLLHQAQIKVH